MQFVINLETFVVDQIGFICRVIDNARLYTSKNFLSLTKPHQLKSSEYGQMIRVEDSLRKIQFGRDYLGHYPLLYACFGKILIIADSIQTIVAWARSHNYLLSFSEQALALYFSIGYVPQGMTLFCQICACENASIYHWENYCVRRESLFEPIEIVPNFSSFTIIDEIERYTQNLARQYSFLDIWCSGGIDSSIMATHCRRYVAQAELLTLGYDPEAIAEYGEGEWSFVRKIQKHTGLKLRYATLDRHNYYSVFQDFCTTFISPTCARSTLPKYILAYSTREAGITGEGGDQLFSGIKNNLVLYLQQKFPSMPLGWTYALAHKKHFDFLQDIMSQGELLKIWVSDYFTQMIHQYSGSLIRKLLYTDIFLKLGSLTFAESYYPASLYHVQIRHPFTSLALYQAALSIEDHNKYVYPQGKIVLSQLYQDQLPLAILKRKKSGTQWPFLAYLSCLLERKSLLQWLSPLQEVPYFKEAWLHNIVTHPEKKDPFLLYQLIVLGGWLSGLSGEK